MSIHPQSVRVPRWSSNTSDILINIGVTGLSILNPCGAAGLLVKAANVYYLYQNVNSLKNDLQNGNYVGAAVDALGILVNVKQLSSVCFAAGTPLLTPTGAKPIEDFKVGDLVLSAPEDDPEGPIAPRRVEELFQRVARVLEVRVGGQVIRTTHEHPFYVDSKTLGKRWLAACALSSGDLLKTHDGRWVPVESISDTDEDVTVYNMRIAEYHTYFVGCAEWGFDVLAHNAAYGSNSSLSQAGGAADKNGLTKAGRGLQKHGDRAGSVFPKSSGNVAARNGQGQQVLDDILNGTSRTFKQNRYGGHDIWDNITRRGARYDGAGNFIGFLDP